MQNTVWDTLKNTYSYRVHEHPATFEQRLGAAICERAEQHFASLTDEQREARKAKARQPNAKEITATQTAISEPYNHN